jgi:hypothetical protein
MRGTGALSGACDSGVLEEEDDELEELEPVPACAYIAGASPIPPTSNPTAAAAIHSRRGASSMRRVAILSRRMAIISRRVAM